MNLKNKIFICSILLNSISLLNAEWITSQPVAWLFAPGIFSNERQIVKYCKEFTASNGNFCYCENDFVVIKPPYHSINFPEIITDTHSARPGQTHSIFAQLYNYITNKIWHIRSKSNDKREHIIMSDTSSVQWIDVKAINFGQEADIKAFSQAYDRLVEQYPDHGIVLYGVSRGAATIMTWLGTEYLIKENKRVKAVVCEGCYDSIETVINNFSVPSIARYIIGTVFSGYNPHGISPISAVNRIPKNIPILFITSQKDSLVPAVCTQQMYDALKRAGHADIHLLKLKHSAHPRYMIDHEEDKAAYQTAVHAFYKKYDLPYDPSLSVLN